MINLLRSI